MAKKQESKSTGSACTAENTSQHKRMAMGQNVTGGGKTGKDKKAK